MKKRSLIYAARDVVFMPALTPLEASVIPAGERRSYGALRHAREAFRPGASADRMRAAYGLGNQRQKI